MNTGKVILIGASVVGLASLAVVAKKVSNISSNVQINPQFSRIHGLQKGKPQNLIVYFRIDTLNNSGFNLTAENIVAEMSYINSKGEFISVGISPRLDKVTLLDGKSQAIDFPFVLNMKETVGLFLNQPNTNIKIDVKYDFKGIPQVSTTQFKAKDYFDISKIKDVASNILNTLKSLFGKKTLKGIELNPTFSLI